MIVYRKSWLGLMLMSRVIGSALPRALIPAIGSTFICLLLETLIPDSILTAIFEHPYPFQVFSYIVAFALVFRTNTAYARYWEMRTHFGQMSSKWLDAAAFAMTFEQLAEEMPRTRSETDSEQSAPASSFW